MSDEPEDRLGMTEEQWEKFQAYKRGVMEQDENGVDISHLRANLRLTPAQRFERHQKALAIVLEVERAGRAAGLRRNSR
jgi:hypothetical protein